MTLTRIKTCKVCRAKFDPRQPMATVCSPGCALTLAQSKRAKAEKVAQVQERRADKAKREKLKTKGEWTREAVAAQLWHRPLVGTVVVFADPGETWIVHMLAGQARFVDGSGLGELGMGDTAVLPAVDGVRTRHALDGGGEALLIRMSAKAEDSATDLAFAAAPD